VSKTEWHVQTLLESLHSVVPQSLTIEQLERCLSAVRFAAPRWQDEYARRQQAIERRREMLGEVA
jgi:hypothetical protein